MSELRIRLFDLPPDNVDAAMAYYRQCAAEGPLSREKIHSLLQLQHDPDRLIKAIAAEREKAAPEDAAPAKRSPEATGLAAKLLASRASPAQ